jgi:hypothetical protein
LKSIFQHWLDNLTPSPEILVCGIRLPDATSLARTWSLAHSIPAFVSLEPLIAEISQMLRMNQLPARRLRLVYENGLVHACLRIDGAACILLTARTATTSDDNAIDPLFTEFESLKPPSPPLFDD